MAALLRPMGTADDLDPTSSLAAKVRKYQRRQAKARSKAAEDRKAAAAWTARRKEAFVRDSGRCRATGQRVKFLTENPLEQAHTHHVIFRSAGGGDELSNLATLGPIAHQKIHHHEWTCDGDANGTLHFTERNLETGRIERVWESTV